ncbi:MAG: hypothetical protein HZB16_12995 [Armatimonadetes bacterium]|nr:hypothetical protein [Armatimonadota bacterium]
MLDQLRSDPMMAGSIWRVMLLALALVMWLLLRNEDDEHEWWGNTMVNLKLSSDAYSAVESSRTMFKWLTILMLAVNLWHGGKMVYRIFPFLGKTVETDSAKPADLPKGYGSGGGGRFVPGQAGPGGAKQGENDEGGGGGLKSRMKDAGSE